MVYETLAIVAALIGLYALVAGKLSTTPINGALVFALMGLCLGPAGLGWVTFELEASHLRLVAEMALALVLFIDASKADLGVLRQSEAIPRRLILRSLPLVMVLGWLFGIVLLPGLSWVEVALLAALLAPTDAALGQAVVSE